MGEFWRSTGPRPGFPALPFAEPLDPAGILTLEDKVRVVDELRARYGLPRSRCVADGDSMSDAPLSRRLGNTVAVNADHHLGDLAAVSYRGDDPGGAYALGRVLLGERRATVVKPPKGGIAG
jgi:phosphoserine phosphatase